MTPAEIATMKRVLPDLKVFFQTRGKVTEEEMDELGVINVNPDDKRAPKNDRALHQQRAVIMNHAECTEAYQQRRAQMVAATEAVAVNKEARLERAAANAGNKIRLEEEKQVRAEQRAATKAHNDAEKAQKAVVRAEEKATREAAKLAKAAALEERERARFFKAAGAPMDTTA